MTSSSPQTPSLTPIKTSYFDLYPAGSFQTTYNHQPYKQLKLKPKKLKPILVNTSSSSSSTTTATKTTSPPPPPSLSSPHSSQTPTSLATKISKLSLRERIRGSKPRSDDERTIKYSHSKDSVASSSNKLRTKISSPPPPLPLTLSTSLSISQQEPLPRIPKISNIVLVVPSPTLPSTSLQSTSLQSPSPNDFSATRSPTANSFSSSSSTSPRRRSGKTIRQFDSTPTNSSSHPPPLNSLDQTPFLSPSHLYTTIRSSNRLPFPVSAPKPDHYPYLQTESCASTSSSLDLFAGPRTSLQYDTRTGEILSAAHDVSAMDALVDTLQETALPPELRNMRRETKQRSKVLAQRDQFEKVQRANRKKTRNPDQSHQIQDSRELKQRTAKSDQYSIIPTPTPIPRAHRNKPTKEVMNKPTLNLAVCSRRLKENGCEIPFPSSPSSDPHRLSPSSFHLARSSSLQSLSCKDSDRTPTAMSHFSKHQQPLSSSTSSATLASRASTSPTTIAPSMGDQVRIPTISEIVARYTATPPIHPSSIAHRSAIPLNGNRASCAIRSIDEIVREYSPTIGQPSSENGELGTSQRSVLHSNIPLRTSLPPSHDRGESHESSDTVSSIDSIAMEALQCVSSQSTRVDKLNPLSKHSRPFSNPDPLRRSNQSDSSKPLATRSATAATPSARQLKKSIRGECPPNVESLSFTAHADEQIANYLQSPRLTTLLRLKKQPNPHMSVSLADVGSSAGHPVIVFLGLGCVRYLVGLYDELAVALGLRLICIDRWGLGKTTEVPDVDRGFLEWSTVVEEVADQLNLGQFSILAHSAGAPYALATTLRLDQRVRGSIHLLAPWVSMTAENGLNAGGYKWLKYLPNSMIKTAQAAEWKMQGWRLGKPPTLARTPVGYDIRAPLSSKDAFLPLKDEEQGLNEAELDDDTLDLLRPSIESRLSDWSRISSDAHWAYSSTMSSSPPIELQSNRSQTPTNDHPQLKLDISLNREIFKKKTSTQSLHHRLRGSPTSPSTISSPPKVKAVKGGAPLLNRNNSASTDQGEPKVRSRTLSSMSDKLGYRNSKSSSQKPTKTGPPSARSAPKANWSTSSTASQNQSVSSYPELGLSLLRASYSESLKGGTSDLMAILERNSKPWGFSYKDVEKGVKIWHGDRDERINLSAAKWMESAMGDCSVKVVEGGDHSLMTNAEVMMDVLESIALDWK